MAGAQVSSSPLLSGSWGSILASPGEGGRSTLASSPLAASRQPLPRRSAPVPTTGCADTALERLGRFACCWRAVWRPPDARKKNLGFPTGRRHFHHVSCGGQCASPAAKVAGTPGVLGTPALCPLLGISRVATGTLGERTEQRSGLVAPQPN